MSAHGLTDALRDAELLARAVVAVHRGEATEPEAYAGVRGGERPAVGPILLAADEVASFGWDEVRIVELLLELNEAMGRELEVINGLRRPIPTAGRRRARRHERSDRPGRAPRQVTSKQATPAHPSVTSDPTVSVRSPKHSSSSAFADPVSAAATGSPLLVVPAP